MPRTARVKSKTGIYHMMLRGINRQTIFEDEEDSTKFLQTLRGYKEKSNIMYMVLFNGEPCTYSN